MWTQFNGRDEWALWLDQFATGRGYMPITSTNLGSTGNFRTRTRLQHGPGQRLGLLRLDPITTTQGRNDATFMVTT
jgi:hypothetical protein